MKNESGSPAPVLRIVAFSAEKEDRSCTPGLDNDDREFRKELRDRIRFRRGDESCNAPEPFNFSFDRF